MRNGYEIKILNMTPQPRRFTFAIEGLDGGLMTVAGQNTAPSKELVVSVKPDQLRKLKVFVRVPREKIRASRQSFNFVAKEIGGIERATYSARFESPKE